METRTTLPERMAPLLVLLGTLACAPRYPGSLDPIAAATTPAQSLDAAPQDFRERLDKVRYRRWAPSVSVYSRTWEGAEAPQQIGDLENGLLMCNLNLRAVPSPGLLRSRLPNPHIQVYLGDSEELLFEDGAVDKRYGFVASAPGVDLAKGERLRVVGISNGRPLLEIDQVFEGAFPIREVEGRGNELECRAATRAQVEERVRPLLRREWREIQKVAPGAPRFDRRFDELAAHLGWADPRIVALRDAYDHALRGELEGWSPAP